MSKKKSQKSQSDWEYFDDCLICQAQKKALKEGRDLTLEEMELVFAKQNLKNRLKDK